MSRTFSAIEEQLRIILSEDVVRLMMKADSVDESDLLALLLAKSSELNPLGSCYVGKISALEALGQHCRAHTAPTPTRFHDQNSTAEGCW